MDIGVYKAISAVQKELAVIGISKDKKNAQQGYNFRGIDDVYDVLAPVLAKHGLCILPRALARSCVERQTKSGGALFNVTVEVDFDLVAAEDGSKHTIRTFGEAMDSADKATNKAMSAAYKYAAFQTFCIPVDVEDADATTPPPVEPKKQTPPPTTDTPKMASAPQIQKIQIIMKERGITDREQILEDLTGFCERPIHSSKELTMAEANAFISANTEAT